MNVRWPCYRALLANERCRYVHVTVPRRHEYQVVSLFPFFNLIHGNPIHDYKREAFPLLLCPHTQQAKYRIVYFYSLSS